MMMDNAETIDYTAVAEKWNAQCPGLGVTATELSDCGMSLQDYFAHRMGELTRKQETRMKDLEARAVQSEKLAQEYMELRKQALKERRIEEAPRVKALLDDMMEGTKLKDKDLADKQKEMKLYLEELSERPEHADHWEHYNRLHATTRSTAQKINELTREKNDLSKKLEQAMRHAQHASSAPAESFVDKNYTAPNPAACGVQAYTQQQPMYGMRMEKASAITSSPQNSVVGVAEQSRIREQAKRSRTLFESLNKTIVNDNLLSAYAVGSDDKTPMLAPPSAGANTAWFSRAMQQ